MLLTSVIEEKRRHGEFYPQDLHFQRINDAVYFTMDLDDLLVPDIGRTSFDGLTPNRINAILKDRAGADEQRAISIVQQSILDSTRPLAELLGFVARFHLSLNHQESAAYFPGAKTVVATGFRKPYVSRFREGPDHLSANFAFSNAYLAEKSLHGPNFYVDNAILQLVSNNKYANNLLRLGHMLFNKESFDCFEASHPSEMYIAAPIKVELFRKDFHFSRLNPSPLSYLQNVHGLLCFLSGDAAPDLSNVFCRHIFNAIKKGISKKRANSQTPVRSFIFNGRSDLSVNIGRELEEKGIGRPSTLDLRHHLVHSGTCRLRTEFLRRTTSKNRSETTMDVWPFLNAGIWDRLHR